ncbi:MAG: dienelactone hydrolase family protein [Pyrinomonadaceae bacterium]
MNRDRIRLVSWASVWCIFLILTPTPQAQDKSNKIVKESIVSNKTKRTYYLLVPSSVSGPAPLVVLLHGSGRNGLSVVEKWKDLAIKEGVIIVGPDAAGGDGWITPRDGPAFLHDLTEELKSKYPVNPRRIYLFGHSGGAVFALMMSMAESEYFAATAVHAGAFRLRDEFQTIDQARRKIPLAIWVGTVDRFFPLASVRATRDALRAKGFTIDVTEMPGHDHWYYDLAPEINAAAWAFLKRYDLPNEPRYTEYVGMGTAGNANKLITEINELSTQARELIDRANQKEVELGGKYFEMDRAQMTKIAQEHMDILAESASFWRAAAEKAESANKLGLSGKHKQYFNLIGQYSRKCGELLDAMRERSAALLSTEPVATIQSMRDEAQKRADKLHQEIDEIQKAIDKLMG